MSKLPRWAATDAERTLIRAGFGLLRSNVAIVSGNGGLRVVGPFHSSATLRPKIVKQVLDAIEEAGRISIPEIRPRRLVSVLLGYFANPAYGSAVNKQWKPTAARPK